jgi:hypothetical protein
MKSVIGATKCKLLDYGIGETFHFINLLDFFMIQFFCIIQRVSAQISPYLLHE